MRVLGPRKVEIGALESRIRKFNLPDVGAAHIRFRQVAILKGQGGLPSALTGFACVLLGDIPQFCVVDQAFPMKV